MKTPVGMLCLCLATAHLPALADMSLEEAGVALGDPSFKIRIFSVLGSNQTDYDLLDSYRQFRQRLSAAAEPVLLTQPLAP